MKKKGNRKRKASSIRNRLKRKRTKYSPAEEEYETIIFMRYTDDQEENDERDKMLAGMPLAYMSPEEFGHQDEYTGRPHYICAECASQCAGGDIDAYNAERGFDWCGKWLKEPDQSNGVDIESPEYQISQGFTTGSPFFVMYADAMTINQVLALKNFVGAGITASKPDWNEMGYEGQSCLFECANCYADCVTVDSRELLTLEK